MLHAAFLDLGFDPDEVVAIVRALVEGLGRAAETMRKAALKAVLRPGATIYVVLELLSLAAGRELPRLRAGIATGWAVSHDGDWYGSPVNLASRLTDVARPGPVVTTTSMREAFTGRGARDERDTLEWSALGAHDLNGVSGPLPPASVRRTGGVIR